MRTNGPFPDSGVCFCAGLPVDEIAQFDLEHDSYKFDQEKIDAAAV